MRDDVFILLWRGFLRVNGSGDRLVGGDLVTCGVEVDVIGVKWKPFSILRDAC